MDIVSNAAYSINLQRGNLSTEYNHIVQISGIGSSGKAKPVLSTLTGLSVQGAQSYHVGDPLNLTVMADYDSGFSRDVTHLAEITDVEMRIPGTRTIQISYEENGVRMDLSFDIEIQLFSGDVIPEEPEIIASTGSSQKKAPKKLSIFPFVVSFVSFLALIALLVSKTRKRPRRRRRKMYL